MANKGERGASSPRDARPAPSPTPSAASRIPPRWSGGRTSFTLLLLILLLGVVPVVLGGEVLGWWQAIPVAPFLQPHALPF